jgi:UPF0716 protein FxsA
MNMFARLVLLFTLVPLLELFILIKLGTVIGALPTVLIVLITGGVGAYLARQQGSRVWWNIQAEMNEGRFPADNLIDGLLLLVAGAVLLTPGLITDVLGLAVLIPVTRAPIRRWIKKRLRSMAQTGNVGFTGFFRPY